MSGTEGPEFRSFAWGLIFMRRFAIARIAIFAASGFILAQTASAQESYSAGQMWGTQPAGVAVPGAVESSAAHFNNGIVAGQVNAARRGLLIATGTGDSITIQSIGSQAVINQTISGHDITSNIDAEQTAKNTGEVLNDGTIKFN